MASKRDGRTMRHLLSRLLARLRHRCRNCGSPVTLEHDHACPAFTTTAVPVCVRCGAPEDGNYWWPSDDGDICYSCWEIQCADEWWDAVGGEATIPVLIEDAPPQTITVHHAATPHTAVPVSRPWPPTVHGQPDGMACDCGELIPYSRSMPAVFVIEAHKPDHLRRMGW